MSAPGAPPGGEGGPVTIGIDVGGTKILGVAVQFGHEVLGEARRPSPHPVWALTGGPASAGTLVDLLAEVAGELRSSLGRSGRPDAVAIGVGVPGLVDSAGRLRLAPNLPAGDDVAVVDLLEARVGIPVMADNDAACAALAELTLGAGRGRSHVLMVTLGTGIGGGLVCDGQVMRGAQGFAGEIGHMVVDPAGPRCTCGKRGCWERFASGSGLARLARESAHAGRLATVVHLAGDPDAVRGEHVTAAAANGDIEARAVLDELGWWIALGLSNLALVLDPELIVLGGGLVDALALVLDTVRRSFAELLEGSERRPEISIVPAALGERAGAIGAALLPGPPGRHGSARSAPRLAG